MKKIVFLITAFLVSLSTMMYAQDLVDSNSLTRTAAISSPPLCSDAAYVLTTSNFPSGSNLIFPSGVYYISSSITISNSNATFQDAEFIIKAGVSITVGSGGTNSSLLTLSSCHLHGCSDMWQGIVLSNNSQLVINGSSHNPTSIIEDATTGIQYLGNEQDLSHTSIRIDNTIFNRNYVGIQISDAPILSSNTNFFRITNTLFTCRDLPYSVGRFSQVGTWLKTSTVLATTTSAIATYPNNPVYLGSPYINTSNYPVTFLKTPYSSSYSSTGIKLNNVGKTTQIGTALFSYTNIIVGNEQSSSANRLTNFFDSHDNGIYSYNSNLTVVNCTFQNGNGKSIGIHAENTPNTEHQLQVVKTNSNGINNAFYDIWCGIESELGNVTINNCDIYGSQNPSLSSTYSGIWLNSYSYSKIQVEHNNIYTIGGPISVAMGSWVYKQLYSGPINVNYNNIHNLPPNYSSSFSTHVNVGITLVTYNSYTPKNTSSVICTKNLIDNVSSGIWFGEWYNTKFVCSNNTINLKELNVNNPTGFGTTVGIYQADNSPTLSPSNLSPNKIIGNTITNDFSNGRYSSTPYGIYSYQSNGVDVRCNSVSGNYYGINFQATNNSSKMAGNKIGSSNTYGYSLSNFGNFAGYTGNQGANRMPSDNHWVVEKDINDNPINWTLTPTGATNPVGHYKTACFGGAIAKNSPLYVEIYRVQTLTQVILI